MNTDTSRDRAKRIASIIVKNQANLMDERDGLLALFSFVSDLFRRVAQAFVRSPGLRSSGVLWLETLDVAGIAWPRSASASR